MNKKDKKDAENGEKILDIKKETVKTDPVHKGYNEKNPAQPQGAFQPDSKKQSK
jgi:hypothetical protein